MSREQFNYLLWMFGGFLSGQVVVWIMFGVYLWFKGWL